ncbi:nuclear transport factor 2 family protein [Haliea sp. E1-2-M8]|uniref:nuclear transport factor 2 family protein n=1 Tax=Haliea sp. E1-2-M8 TaxID=3064706 RepID=UPI00271CB3F1|nr:nuclear transport factor 2 family protein [Haliea sp. E1-2-M8]MDO8863045.1 nuclear transport factor 2 family protein [Haliea sp. E1-2-M8]
MDEALMRRYYATYNSEAPEVLADFYHPDCTLESAQGTLRGRGAILDTYRALIGMFEDRMTPTEITVNGNEARVIIVDRFTARTDVTVFLGQSLAAGESFELQLEGYYRAEQGQLREIRIEMAES